MLLSANWSRFLRDTGCSSNARVNPTQHLQSSWQPGAGLVPTTGWALVQSRVSEFARVCSYDPLGAVQSDHVPGSHPVSEVVENMHDLFHSAQIPGPFILVGNSLEAVLIRQYEEQYPSEVAGFCLRWTQPMKKWNRAMRPYPPALIRFGVIRNIFRRMVLLPPRRLLAWHDDVPMIILERTELPPCSAFPGLTQAQCDQINRAWHDFQVDLSRRSRYGQLPAIAGSGHLMQQQKPEAISQAVSDVINQVNLKPI